MNKQELILRINDIIELDEEIYSDGDLVDMISDLINEEYGKEN